MNAPLLPRIHKPTARRRLRPALALCLGLAVFPCSALSYTEYFNDNLAQNWAATSGTWPTPTSQVYTETDVAAVCVSTYTAKTWNTDFTYTAKVYVGTGNPGTGNRLGLVYNYVSPANYAYVQLSGNSTKPIFLGRVTSTAPYSSTNGPSSNPAGSLLVTSNYDASPVDGWLTISVIRTGTKTTIKVNDISVSGMTNLDQSAQSLGTGSIGLMANWTAGTFDEVSVGIPDVNVSGNDVIIVDGDTTPSINDHTDFGSVPISGGSNLRTFWIENLGTSPLTIGTVSKSGTNAAEFTVTQPATTRVGPGNAVSLMVNFDPGAAGLRTASLSFTNSDTYSPSESPYNFNIQGTGDSTAPTVSMTAPADSSTVFGTNVTVSATASDNIGVTGVQFNLDGAPLGDEDLVAPYEVPWNTTLSVNGLHILAATARDAANNQTTTSNRLVTVNNGGALPSMWTKEDIGDVGAAGSATWTNNVYTVSGSGAGAWFTSDEFYFVHVPMTGNCTIIAKVDSVSDVTGVNWEHAGIMIRDTLEPNSAFAALYQTPTNGLNWERRLTTDGSAGNDGFSSLPGVTNAWLKLVRSGDTFTASYSTDGVNWSTVGTSKTVAMSQAVYVGLAVTAQLDGSVCMGTFSNVQVMPGDGDPNATRPWPRLAGISNGSGKHYDRDYFQNWAKKLDMVIIGAYAGWHNSDVRINPGTPLNTIVEQIKAGSPKPLPPLVFQYCNTMEQKDGVGSGAEQGMIDKINAMNWWAYDLGTSGARTETNHGFYINGSEYAPNSAAEPPDYPDGLSCGEWMARWQVEQLYYPGTGVGGPALALDGFFNDNMSCQPEHGGNTPDWDRDEILELWEKDIKNETNRAVWRAGRAKTHPAVVRAWNKAGNGGGIQICNSCTWPKVNQPRSSYPMPGYDDVWQGGCGESIVGAGASPEGYWNTWGSFTKLREWYTWQMDRLISPKLFVFHLNLRRQLGGASIPPPEDYDSVDLHQEVRYSMAACYALENGYFAASGKKNYSTDADNLLWFDEYDNVGTDPDYLGQPVNSSFGNVQTAPRWSKGTLGVWAREFTGGIVICNPWGNGPQTITVGPTGDLQPNAWKRINHAPTTPSDIWGDPNINNGEVVVTDIDLNDRDGIILLRNQ